MNKKGFTLIEVVIVILILGILVAVAVPLYVDYLEVAKKETYGVLEESMETATNDYLISNLNGAGDDSFSTYEEVLLNGGLVNIPLRVLVESNRLPDVVDPAKHGSFCDYDSSYVRVLKFGNPSDINYKYDAYLECSEYTTDLGTLICGDYESCMAINNLNITSVREDYNYTTVNVSFEQIAAVDMYVSLSNLGDGSTISNSEWKEIDTEFTMDFLDYDSSIKMDGRNVTIYIYLRDYNGDILKVDRTYKLYSDCTTNIVVTNQSEWTSCSETCGGGESSRTTYYNDSLTGNTCPTTTETKSCNTQSCLTFEDLDVVSTNSSYNWTTVNLTFTHIAGVQMYISTTGYEVGGEWETINPNKILDLKTLKSNLTLNGGTVRVYVTVKSAEGHKLNLSDTYVLYNECNAKYTTVKSSPTSCSAVCGGGSTSTTTYYYDSLTSKSCPNKTVTDTKSCNTQSCCSSTKVVCDSTWSVDVDSDGNRLRPWSENPYTKECDNYSNYNGAWCSNAAPLVDERLHDHSNGGYSTCVSQYDCYIDNSYFNTYLKDNCGSTNYKGFLDGVSYNITRPQMCSVCGDFSYIDDSSYNGFTVGIRPVNYCVYTSQYASGTSLGGGKYITKNHSICTFPTALPPQCINS